jgi:hypothetical protein
VVAAVSEDGYTEYWAAAVPPHEAVEAVRSMVHPDRKLTLTERRLPARLVAELKLRPGSVRKLKDGR